MITVSVISWPRLFLRGRQMDADGAGAAEASAWIRARWAAGGVLGGLHELVQGAGLAARGDLGLPVRAVRGDQDEGQEQDGQREEGADEVLDGHPRVVALIERSRSQESVRRETRKQNQYGDNDDEDHRRPHPRTDEEFPRGDAGRRDHAVAFTGTVNAETIHTPSEGRPFRREDAARELVAPPHGGPLGGFLDP
ncbi:hypothetical protein ACIGN6_25775 [Streptomyces sp. NPDC053792]|uniref:hypothetical protein n=1 Tax=unclassified Streptomyces TaxID=2593676 RepID=UPI00343F6614